MEAGDADTNCAVAGALLGYNFSTTIPLILRSLKYGYSGIPTKWLDSLPHQQWLLNYCYQFVAQLGI